MQPETFTLLEVLIGMAFGVAFGYTARWGQEESKKMTDRN